MTRAADVLAQAGWFPGRNVDVSSWCAALADEYVLHRAAEEFLSEFGGLRIGKWRDLFEFDPVHGKDDGGRLAAWGEELGRSLFPVGACLSWHPFTLAIDETTELYLVAETIATYGPMPDALNRLLLGKAPRCLDEPEGAGPSPRNAYRVTRSVRSAYRRPR